MFTVAPDEVEVGVPEIVLLKVNETSLRAWPGDLKSVFDNILEREMVMLFVPIVKLASPLRAPSPPEPDAKNICAEALAGMRAMLANTRLNNHDDCRRTGFLWITMDLIPLPMRIERDPTYKPGRTILRIPRRGSLGPPHPCRPIAVVETSACILERLDAFCQQPLSVSANAPNPLLAAPLRISRQFA